MAPFAYFLKATSRAFLNLIFPNVCPLCSNLLMTQEQCICQSCFKQITPLRPPLCRRCQVELPPFQNEGICTHCRSEQFYFSRVHAAVRYDGAVRRLLHAVKFERKHWLLKPLQPHFENVVARLDPRRYDLITPVPLHRSRLRQRGFNQALLVAQMANTVLERSIESHILKRVHHLTAQSLLNRKERMKHLAGAFQYKGRQPLRGARILLVDDVFTTGSTANECARILRQAGAKRVDVLVLARTM